MKALFPSVLVVVLMIAMGRVSGAQDAPQVTQALVGSTITYQGRLVDGGAPADGAYDLRFRLLDAPAGGNPVGAPIARDDQPVEDGLFTVPLDFGQVFDGTALWLQVEVRPGDADTAYEELSPRQPLSAAPYALHSTGSWNLKGNGGTSPGLQFLGTTDALPLVIKTNNAEAMRVDAAGRVSVGSSATSARFEASGVAGGDIAVMGTSSARGVVGRLGIGVSCPGTYGVGGCAGTTGGAGVFGTSDSGVGVQGRSSTGRAVEGFSDSGIGVLGDSPTRGVVGTLGRTSCAGAYAVGGCAGSAVAAGVYGYSANAVAVLAASNGGNLYEGQTGTTRVFRVDQTGRGFFNGGTQTGGADYADSMPTSDDPDLLEPGDVLAIDPENGGAVRRSREPNSRLVAGVYSTRPSILAVGSHHIDDALTGEVPVALVGIVPTKVAAENGPIAVGDLLVTSSLAGHAMKALPHVVDGVELYPTGAILGKALGSLRSGTGVIQVLVTLR